MPCLLTQQVVIGEGHTLEAHERVSLCKQRPSHANESDDELEYAAKDGDDDGPCPFTDGSSIIAVIM